MEKLNKRQVIDRLKRVAMTNLFVAYVGKGFFLIKDSNEEATKTFFKAFNNITSDCACIYASNSIEGPIYKVL
jgi:hypothetical protein